MNFFSSGHIMSVVETSKFYKGLKIIYEDDLWEIIEFQHRVMQQRAPVVKTKLKNIFTGLVQEKSFRSGDTFSLPDLTKKDSQILFTDEDSITFMDLESFEQYQLNIENLGDKKNFIKEEQNVLLLHYNGSPIDLELPTHVELQILETEPGLKGDSVTGGNKPAKLETGAEISVPLFINIGDFVKVDTRDGKYLERTKKA